MGRPEADRRYPANPYYLHPMRLESVNSDYPVLRVISDSDGMATIPIRNAPNENASLTAPDSPVAFFDLFPTDLAFVPPTDPIGTVSAHAAISAEPIVLEDDEL